jgi:hypothetical protein
MELLELNNNNKKNQQRHRHLLITSHLNQFLISCLNYLLLINITFDLVCFFFRVILCCYEIVNKYTII